MVEYIFKKIQRYFRYGYVSFSGRNNTGIVCVHHQGGGNKRRGYKVDFFRRINSFGLLAKVKKTSFFSGLLGLILYQNGITSYILLADQINIGEEVFSGTTVPPTLQVSSLLYGSSFPLLNVPIFTRVFMLSIGPLKVVS